MYLESLHVNNLQLQNISHSLIHYTQVRVITTTVWTT